MILEERAYSESDSEEQSSEEEEYEEEEEEYEEEEEEDINVKPKSENKKDIEKNLDKKETRLTPSFQTNGINSHNSPKVETSSISSSRKISQQRITLLKSIMLSKAREELQREAERKAEEKKAALSKRMETLGDLQSKSQQELIDICRALHAKIEKVDEQRYDIETKVRKNDQEIEDLKQKIFELRGKFRRPPLRRVRMSADQMLRALLGSKHKVSLDLRSNLKAVKKEVTKREEVDSSKNEGKRENLDGKQEMESKAALFRGGNKE